ncbi:MAG TPA: sugar phosphate nucleotidyltransferase [Thermoanaerobaculia bacterium]|nr:sugar phosphate nucleotidyltransferase [Thermoanaerobaculia bacterium]
MRAILLCAGKGTRFRPVTDAVPKPLLPFLNVPVAAAHLERLQQAGIGEVAVNLHHLGDQVERRLRQQAARSPQLTFFREPVLLGTAGALRNAATFLSAGADDFLVVNSDAAITPRYADLLARHRDSRRPATLLVTENRDPDRYTPLQSEGDRITGFGPGGVQPLMYTGVCILASRLLSRIPEGETSLVADLWQPLLAEGREQIGFVLHSGGHADLGRPGDFLGATLEALARGGPFPTGAGSFDLGRRALTLRTPSEFEAFDCVLGNADIGVGSRLERCAVWDGVAVGAGARLTDCVAARGRVPDGAHYEKALLWSPDGGGSVSAFPLAGLDRNDHGVHPLSPRR